MRKKYIATMIALTMLASGITLTGCSNTDTAPSDKEINNTNIESVKTEEIEMEDNNIENVQEENKESNDETRGKVVSISDESVIIENSDEQKEIFINEDTKVYKAGKPDMSNPPEGMKNKEDGATDTPTPLSDGEKPENIPAPPSNEEKPSDMSEPPANGEKPSERSEGGNPPDFSNGGKMDMPKEEITLSDIKAGDEISITLNANGTAKEITVMEQFDFSKDK